MWIRIQKGKMFNYKQKKCKEIGNNCKLIQICKVNLHKLYCFLLRFEQSIMFFQLKNSLVNVNFFQFLSWSGFAFKKQLDPDPHREKIAVSGSAKNEFGTTALVESLVYHVFSRLVVAFLKNVQCTAVSTSLDLSTILILHLKKGTLTSGVKKCFS